MHLTEAPLPELESHYERQMRTTERQLALARAVIVGASLVTILVNSVLVRSAPAWIGYIRLAGQREPTVSPADHRARHVVLCGFGRVGSAIGEAFDTFGIPYTVIERDPDIPKALRTRGVPAYFGDAAHRNLLIRAGADRAPLVIVALPDIDSARLAVRAARALNRDVPILARAHGRGDADGLRQVGATEVIQPELEASATLIRHALATLKLPKSLALAYLERFRTAMEEAESETVTAQQPLPEVQTVRIGSAIADQSLREAQIRERFGVTVVAVSRSDGVVLNPPPETILRDGDTVRVFGLPDQIAAFVLAAAGSRA